MSLSTINHQLSTVFADRLVTLSDGRPGLRGGIHVQVAALADPQPSTNNPQPVLDFISSDDTLDRYGEIVSAAGWHLADYQRNPVFQNAHQYGDVIFTLGKALITEVRTVAGRQVLFQRIEFATQANPMARIAHGLYSGGFLNTVSVGFIPLRWQDGDPTVRTPREAPDKLSTLNSQPSTNYRRRYLEQELLEVSAVAIPANPNALALGLKSGAVEKTDLRELSDLLRQTLAAPDHQLSTNDHQPLSAHPTSAGSPPIHPLLPFARAIRDQLKKL
jgi:uncharacterized protein